MMPQSIISASQARHISLNGQSIPYTLCYSKRRTLGLRVDERGLIVSVPLNCSKAETEHFLCKHANWIIEKLEMRAQQLTLRASITLKIADGTQFSVLGEPCTIRLSADTNHVHWVEGVSAQGRNSREIHLGVRGGGDTEHMLCRSLQRYALAYFKVRAEVLGSVLKQHAPHIILPAIRLTDARMRWGSCSKVSGIRLNWRLIHLPLQQIDYVIAHELSHLLEMNHSSRFWAEVERLFPDYKDARRALKNALHYVPVWGG